MNPAGVKPTTTSLLRNRANKAQLNDEKNLGSGRNSIPEGSQRICLSKPRRMLSGKARHDVQCRSPSTADRLLDRGCPNKVSMKKRKKKKDKRSAGGRGIYTAGGAARDSARLSEGPRRAPIGWAGYVSGRRRNNVSPVGPAFLFSFGKNFERGK